MREVVFIKQNTDKWKQFESMLQSKDRNNPDEIASLYIQLIDDLSYARTFYSASPVCNYLNDLSGKAHIVIYKNKKEKKSRIVEFWRTELPAIFYSSHRSLLIAFLIFIVSALIGVISAKNDDSFIRLILGDGYVDMTLENIRNGHPLAVYNSSNELMMFFEIATNNIKVAFIAYAAGILISFGSAYFLLYNGIMVGVFQYFCYQEGALKESILTIWLHGTIEISVIIIAGCAGLVMGNSILFPGTYSRAISFKQGAVKGLKIVIGTVPFFIIAATIESFITRHARASQLFDGLLIFLSLTLIIWYFVIYPIRLNKKTSIEDIL